MARYADKFQRERQKTDRQAFTRLLISLLCVLLLATALSIYIKQDKEMEALAIEREGLQQQLERAQARHDEIESLKQRVGTPEFIERVARDELGMVRPDEIVFTD